MSLRLTIKQKAAIHDCSCPLPENLRRKRISKKAAILPFVVFGLVVYLMWALWPPGALWLLGIYGLLLVGSIVYRLVRGHTIWCSLKWSPVATLYTIGDAVASAGL